MATVLELATLHKKWEPNNEDKVYVAAVVEDLATYYLRCLASRRGQVTMRRYSWGYRSLGDARQAWRAKVAEQENEGYQKIDYTAEYYTPLTRAVASLGVLGGSLAPPPAEPATGPVSGAGGVQRDAVGAIDPLRRAAAGRTWLTRNMCPGCGQTPGGVHPPTVCQCPECLCFPAEPHRWSMCAWITDLPRPAAKWNGTNAPPINVEPVETVEPELVQGLGIHRYSPLPGGRKCTRCGLAALAPEHLAAEPEDDFEKKQNAANRAWATRRYNAKQCPGCGVADGKRHELTCICPIEVCSSPLLGNHVENCPWTTRLPRPGLVWTCGGELALPAKPTIVPPARRALGPIKFD